ncbi:hypothetical protein CIHG_00554 [Coccidioides immitis H538.4]|uniref:CFEM domain-containing protein n=2 Tax=Coccidioides immitis TaxID=5501 RepID=A0A0J8QHD9_COCIT|nr:hypothetical protein CISG_00170 [Coccidioides immitis RMSCC 3703]KMU82772.1 hypothetical protein CIHG_00554 [Coccidioides immitis H538.4]TPX19575.1 hypothetical protein DIZ76_017367 [Coccidioides immitis]
MKIYQSTAVLWLIVHQASATLWGHGSFPFFRTPLRCDNVCTPGQEKGYDWGGIGLGLIDLFDDFNFSGFTCKNILDFKKWTGKFQDKCIEGTLQKDKSLCPTIISSRRKGFSIDTFHITVDIDIDVAFEYNMPDGKTCREIHPCSPGGSIIKNTQCGGATSVSFFIPSFALKAKCKFAIHKIIFKCGPPQFTKTVVPSLPASTTDITLSTQPTRPSTTESVDVTTTSAPSVTTSTEGGNTPGQSSTDIIPGESSTVIIPGESSTVIVPGESTTEVVPGESTPVITPTVSLSTSTVFTTSLVTITSCAPDVPDCPAQSQSTVVVTSTVAISTTLCPITITPTEPAGPSSTPGIPGQPSQPGDDSSNVPIPTEITQTNVPGQPSTTSGASPVESTPNVPGQPSQPGDDSTNVPIPTETTQTNIPGQPSSPQNSSPVESTPNVPGQPTTTSGSSPVESSPSIPVPTSPCPDVVPKCFNTWLELLPKCNSNSDASCFCPSSEFTSEVIKCIEAWGASDEEVRTAISFFTGICAPYIPKNPGIITKVPTYIPIGPPPTATAPAGVTVTQTVPCTTITVSQVITLTNAEPTTLTTEITVPQVSFTTGGPGPNPTVDLIPGPAPALSTPSGEAGPGASTLLTVPATAPGGPRPTGPEEFTGAAASFSVSGRFLFSAAAAAVGFIALQMM